MTDDAVPVNIVLAGIYVAFLDVISSPGPLVFLVIELAELLFPSGLQQSYKLVCKSHIGKHRCSAVA
jgi:hypothetical protein